MATFVLPLASCLTCDGRRIDIGDTIAIYLDTYKFPLVTEPIRAAVLEVRLPEPPEPPESAVSLVVQAADEDLPPGVATLEHDDIEYIKCIDCCWRMTERLDDIESQIPGTKETLFSILPPFVPSSLTIVPSAGPQAVLTYDGIIEGRPAFSSGGTYPILRTNAGKWQWIPASGQIYTPVKDAPLPWLVTTEWRRSPIVAVSLFFSGAIPNKAAPIPPEDFSDLYRNTDLVLAKDVDGTVWSWSGVTWDAVNESYQWDVALSPEIQSPKVGSIYVLSSNGAVNANPYYAGDSFVLTSDMSLLQIGASGTYEQFAVKTYGNQTIGGNKSFTGSSSFSALSANAATIATLTATAGSLTGLSITSPIIVGGTINATAIGNITPTTGSFSGLSANTAIIQSATAVNGLTLGSPSSSNGVAIFSRSDSAYQIGMLPLALTANRTQSLADKDGTIAVVASATGLPNISEIEGIVYGQATLAAGTVAITITGASATSLVVGLVPKTNAAYVLSGVCTTDTLTITSSNAADTRVIQYLVIL